MAEPITLVPLVLRDVELLFGEDPAAPDFRHHTNVMQWTPTASPVRVGGLGDTDFLDPGKTVWTLDLAVAQDWDTAGSLANYLYEHEGETIKVRTRPRAGKGPTFAGSVMCLPTAIGGTGGQEARSTVSLPAMGRPKIVPAA